MRAMRSRQRAPMRNVRAVMRRIVISMALLRPRTVDVHIELLPLLCDFGAHLAQLAHGARWAATMLDRRVGGPESDAKRDVIRLHAPDCHDRVDRLGFHVD